VFLPPKTFPTPEIPISVPPEVARTSTGRFEEVWT